MSRCQRVDTGFVHGTDNEKQDALSQVACVPIDHPCQRWELEQLIDRELPAHLQATALYASCGLTQEQSAVMHSVSERTIRSRLKEIRDLLCPQDDVGAMICEALQECLDKPSKTQSLLALLAG